MSVDLPHRRRIRLTRSAYATPGAVCSVTIATKARNAVFADAAVAEAAVDALAQHVRRTAVPIHAFCVMPDHIHLVLSPSPTHDIVTFVGEFKNLVQRAAWRQGVAGPFWQTSFWDHFVRDDAHFQAVIRYVLDNPVRAGLVVDSVDYPFCGSISREFADREDSDRPAAGDKPPPYGL